MNDKKEKKSQMIKIQRKVRTMDFETLRFFFIPWKIPENLLADNGQQITKANHKNTHVFTIGK